jgi:hypothetical protein
MGAVLVCMAGCSRTNSVEVRLPNAAVGAVIHCQHKADCYLQASRVCGGPYDILQADDKPANDFTTSPGVVEYVIECEALKSISEDSHAPTQ